MKYPYSLLAAGLFVSAFFSNCRQPQTTQQNTPATPVATIWPAIKKENRPWTRWWWMGSAVDEKNIGRLLKEYADAGLGGVEIAPIYGAMGHEARYIEYLSPKWMGMLDFTVKTAQDLGMGVDMTQGTGWPFGGPQVTQENAASKLIIQKYTLTAGQALTEPIVVKEAKQVGTGILLQAVTAYGEKGEILVITDKVDAAGKLSWSPKSGTWNIYAAFNGKTRQMVKRAAPGGVGFTLDHLSKDAVQAYLNRFGQVFNAGNRGVRAFYNDSYEVYGASWTPAFFDEFQKRRGYDLRLYLRELNSDEKTDLVARVKGDYRETMSQMLLENFTQPWTNWAHQRNSFTKNQAHGSPGNLLDLYAAVDIPETETFGATKFAIPGHRRDTTEIGKDQPDPVMLKFASSAGHTSGKNLVSSETLTWLGEHFKTSFAQGKPEVEQLFLSGINHVFFHGVTYSPEDVAWPGWLFYASLNLTPANSLWPHFNGLNQYITRVQSVLQAGQADNELAVYWPVYDYWNQPNGRERLITVHNVDSWLLPTPFYKGVKSLMDIGYSMDFVSDKMLADARVANGSIKIATAAPNHQVLLVPQSKYMPLATLENVIRLAKNGATVIIEELPEDVPGLHNLAEKRQQLKQIKQSLTFTNAGNGVQQMKTGSGQILLSKNVQQALQMSNINREELTDTGLKFIRRDLADGKYYYLVNHTAKAIDTQIPLNISAASIAIMDPQSSRVGLASTTKAGDKTNARVQLQSGEALILRASESILNQVPAWQYLDNASAPIAVKADWQLHFTKGGPELPADQKLTQLISWTELADKKGAAFSGSGEYTTTFTVPGKKNGEYILDLGKVNESARVWVNGQEVGYIWSIPFKARIGQYVKPGKNTLKVEVANLMANRIRDMDRKKIEWRRYHEINFVNIHYKPFDASGWKSMPSGLLGPVTITPYN